MLDWIVALLVSIITMIYYVFDRDSGDHKTGGIGSNSTMYIQKQLEEVADKNIVKCEKPIVESAIHPQVNVILAALFAAPDNYLIDKIFKIDYRSASDKIIKKVLKGITIKNPKHVLHEIQNNIKMFIEGHRITLDIGDIISNNIKVKTLGNTLKFICKIFGIPISTRIGGGLYSTQVVLTKKDSRLIREIKDYKLISIVYNTEDGPECLFLCGHVWYRLYNDDVRSIDENDIDNYFATRSKGDIVCIYRKQELKGSIGQILSLDGEISDPELLAHAVEYYMDRIRARNVLFMADHNIKLMMLLIHYAKPKSAIVYTRLPIFTSLPMPIAKTPDQLMRLSRQYQIDAIVTIGWEPIPFAGDYAGVRRLVLDEYDALNNIRVNHGNLMWYDYSRKLTNKSPAWTRSSLGTSRTFYVDKATLGGIIVNDIEPFIREPLVRDPLRRDTRYLIPFMPPVPTTPPTPPLLFPAVPTSPPTPPLLFPAVPRVSPYMPSIERIVEYKEPIPDPYSEILGGKEQ